MNPLLPLQRRDLPQQYQYRTFDYAYHFKIKSNQTVAFKIYNVSGQVLSKSEFSLANIPSGTFSEKTVSKILPILVSKNLMPAQYLPFDPPAKAVIDPPPPITLPSPSSSALITPSDSLDLATITLLKDFAQKSQKIFDAAQKTEQKSIQAVLSNPQAIHNLIISQNEEDQALRELLILQQKEAPYKYYETFYQKITGICIASYTIKCGMVGNTQKNNLAYIGLGMECVGQVIPVFGSSLTIIGEILKLKNIKDNNRAVANITRFFADFEKSLKNIKTIARILTREQEQDLLVLKPQTPFRKTIETVKDWFNADETNNPIVFKAVEDCQILIEAILTQGLSSQTSPEVIVSYILGRPLSVPAPAATLPISDSEAITTIPSSTTLIDPASKEDVEYLQKKFNTLEVVDNKELRKWMQESERKVCELDAVKADNKKLHKQLQKVTEESRLVRAYMETAFGPLVDLGNQMQFQDQTNLAKAKSPGFELLCNINRLFQELSDRIDQISTALLINQENIADLQRKQEEIEFSNKSRKGRVFNRRFS